MSQYGRFRAANDSTSSTSFLSLGAGSTPTPNTNSQPNNRTQSNTTSNYFGKSKTRTNINSSDSSPAPTSPYPTNFHPVNKQTSTRPENRTQAYPSNFLANQRRDNNTLDEQALNDAKKKLKHAAKFEEAVETIGKLMEEQLTTTNKQKFYGALTSVSFCVGGPGFSSSAAQKLFEIALGPNCLSKWSPGYLRNIQSWKAVVDSMVAGTWDPATYTKDDGRFGTNPAPRSTPVNTNAAPRTSSQQTQRNLSAAFLQPWGFARNFNPTMNMLSLLLQQPSMTAQRYFDSSDDDEWEEPYPFLDFAPQTALLQPTTIQHSEKPITSTLRFIVDNELAELISNNNLPEKYKIHLVVYDTHITPTKSPQHVQYKLNNSSVTIKGGGREVEFGYDITSLCFKGENRLQVTALKCCCSFKFGVRVVKSMTEKLMDDVKRSILTKTESLAHIKNSFASQGDVMELHITISLLCPLGQMFIETPVRSKNCKHIQCFDLETYMLMNRTDPTWSCPVCTKPAYVENLIVDEYMAEILKKIGDDSVGENIKIDENGKWELFSIEFGDHSESDDDGEVPLKKRPAPDFPMAEPPPKIMRSLAPPPKPIVIDLTL